MRTRPAPTRCGAGLGGKTGDEYIPLPGLAEPPDLRIRRNRRRRPWYRWKLLLIPLVVLASLDALVGRALVYMGLASHLAEHDVGGDAGGWQPDKPSGMVAWTTAATPGGSAILARARSGRTPTPVPPPGATRGTGSRGAVLHQVDVSPSGPGLFPAGRCSLSRLAVVPNIEISRRT